MATKIKYDPGFDALSSDESKLLEEACEAISTFLSRSDVINNVPFKTRDAHVTAYSTLKGTFTVSENFEEQSVFPQKNMDCLIRISNAHMKVMPQKRTIPAYGFSLQLSHNHHTIANFPMVNFPLFPINNVSRFLKIFIAVNQFFSGSFFSKIFNSFRITKYSLMTLPAFLKPDFVKEVFRLVRKRKNFILSFDYHSIGVYRLGDHLVKLKLVPKNVSSKPDTDRIDWSIQNYIKEHKYELDLMVQYCYDLQKHPVNQLNTLWQNSPFVSIGTITTSEIIDKNNMDIENLSFNPFENIKELQPVGRLQKLRDKAYKTSYKIRKNKLL